MSEAYVYGKHRDSGKQLKRYKRFKLATKLLVLIMVISGAYVGYDIYSGRKKEQPVVSKTQKIEVVASSQTYNTEYFQFSAEKDWVLDEKNSTKTEYIYRRYQSELIEHELTIYVNSPKKSFEATHVMPVGIDGSTKMIAGPVSEHCKSTYPPKGGNRNPSVVKLANTSLLCNPEDIRYRLVVGVVNAGNEIKLKRVNGEVATFVITYNDLTFANSGRDISKIINTFEAK
jgi:hypothetical protein